MYPFKNVDSFLHLLQQHVVIKITLSARFNSKRYDHTREEILLSNIVAINKTAVIEPSFNQLSVGDHIEYEFVAKKGKVQLWRGVVVSTDPDAEHRMHWFGTQRAGDNVQTSAMSPYHYQRSESSEHYGF